MLTVIKQYVVVLIQSYGHRPNSTIHDKHIKRFYDTYNVSQKKKWPEYRQYQLSSDENSDKHTEEQFITFITLQANF